MGSSDQVIRVAWVLSLHFLVRLIESYITLTDLDLRRRLDIVLWHLIVVLDEGITRAISIHHVHILRGKVRKFLLGSAALEDVGLILGDVVGLSIAGQLSVASLRCLLVLY